MIHNQTFKYEIINADMNMVLDIYELVHTTIKEIYNKYYSDEAVKFFLELHSKENISADISNGKVYVAVHEHNVVGTGTLDGDHIKRLFVLPQLQGQGMGTLIMDTLETEIIKNYGAAWLDSSLPAGKFYHNCGYVTKKYEEIQLENDKVLAYEIMCRNKFPLDPNEYNAPSQLVRREMELQNIDLNELKKIFPKRLYLLADSLYDTMLSKNAGTLTYHVGGEVYVMNHDHSVGFVKGEMCSPGIATQAEDLIAAGAKELIHVGFAGGYPGSHIGDVVITDGAFHDTAVAGLFAAAKFRSCRAAGIYVISDSGSGDDWDLGWGEKTLETSIDRVITAIVNND